MATLILKRAWLNLCSTGVAIAAPTTGRSQVWSNEGETRTYAGGHQRSITQEGERGRFAFTMRLLTLDQIETLKTWKGQTVQFRDHRGQRLFGVFRQVTPVELTPPTLYDAAIEIQLVTYNEEV
jgi:hypothetical protein